MASFGNQENPPPADISGDEKKKRMKRQKERAKRKQKILAQKKVMWPPVNYSTLVSINCFRALEYVSQRSRFSKDLERRLIEADKLKDFDWSSVFRGEENEELIKRGIEPAYLPTDYVNFWPNASDKCMRLLTLLFAEGKLTYELQSIILYVDKQIRAANEDGGSLKEDIIARFLGEKFSHFASSFV